MHISVFHNRSVHHRSHNERVDLDHNGIGAGQHRSSAGQAESAQHQRRTNGAQSVHLATDRRQRSARRSSGRERELQYRTGSTEGSHPAQRTA